MTIEMAVDLLQTLVTQALMTVAPMLATAIVVGVLISIIQTVTSIQDQTLTFVPKIFAIGVVGLATVNWMLRFLMDFATAFLTRLPEMAP